MKTRTHNYNPKSRAAFVRMKYRATCEEWGHEAKAPAALDYNPADDGTRGGYTYGDDWSGDDMRALCDIFGA